MNTSILHHDVENAIATNYDLYPAQRETTSLNISDRTYAVVALLAAVLGAFILPLLVAIPLGHYVLAVTDRDAPDTDLRTPVTRGIAAVSLIIGYVWVAVLLFAWLA